MDKLSEGTGGRHTFRWWLVRLLRDARLGGRVILKDPGFSFVAIVTLALGVGVNATLVGLVDALLFRPPAHVLQPDQVVIPNSFGTFVEYRRLSESLQTMDLASYTRQMLPLEGPERGALIPVECVTHTYFPLLGVSPFLGRTFRAEEDAENGRPLAVLGYGLWLREFGGAESVIGRPVRINDRDYETVGVMPRRFRGVELQAEETDAWILIQVSPEACSTTGRDRLAYDGTRGGGWLNVIGRVDEDYSVEEAESEIAGSEAARLRQSNGVAPDAFTLEPLYELSSRLEGGELGLWLAAGAGLVLLISCANVTGLQATRVLGRSRELAIRFQLGASRSLLCVQVLAESVVLGLISTTVAVFVMLWTATLVRRYFEFLEPTDYPDMRTFVALVSFALFSGFATGLLPAWQIARSDAIETLRSGRTTFRANPIGRRALLVFQTALALVLVVSAGLFVRSLNNLHRGLGYDPSHVVVANLNLARAGYEDGQVPAILEAVIERVEQSPAVESASIAFGTFLNSGSSGLVIPGPADVQMVLNAVSPGYFETLGTRILRGRAFQSIDTASSTPVSLSALIEVDRRRSDLGC